MPESARDGRSYALIGVMVAFSWPSLANLITGGGNLTSTSGDVRTIAIEWSIALILAAMAFGGQGLRPQYFRLTTFGWRDLLYMIGALVVTFVIAGIISRVVAPPQFDIKRIASVPILARATLVITAGICEEFIFRGFAIEEIGLLTGNRTLGATLSVIFFGLGHAGTYGFSTALLIPTTIGVMITLLYMRRNSLPACMLMHATIDGLVVILVPALTAK